jgi:hypothetical protein
MRASDNRDYVISGFAFLMVIITVTVDRAVKIKMTESAEA